MGPPRLWLVAAALSASWRFADAQVLDPSLIGGGSANPNLVRDTPIEACQRVIDSGGTPSPFCGKRWAVTNAVQVPEFWEVHELEFYWDRHCTLRLPLGTPISSQVNSGFQENIADMAWDAIIDTKWTGNCRALLGGCNPRQTWIGIDIGGNGLGINLETHHQYASVRCLKIYQSPNVSRQSLEVAFGMFHNESDASFEELGYYTAFSGGAWQVRPSFEAGLWRMRNVDATDKPWKVAELLVYSDRFCENAELHGIPIASGSFLPFDCVDQKVCDEFAPWKAFDGVTRAGQLFPDPLPSMWQANCHQFGGCSAMEAFIGMDYGFQPVTLQCIRIFQPTHDGWPAFGDPTFTSGVVMEFWDGYIWRQDEVLSGLGHGGWNETRPQDGFAWRLNNFDYMLDAWRIYELQLFRDRECGTLGFLDRELGLPISSNPKLPFSQQDSECRLEVGSCSFLTHDKKVGTAWHSRCSGCNKAEAWVGLLFHDKPRDIQCFKVIQSGELRHRTNAVELSMWNGEAWVVKRFESDLGGGTWNYRPTSPLSAWRFLGTSVTDLPWKVQDIAFYSDVECNNELLAPEIGSGGPPLHRVSHAFDHDNTTEFEASCPPRFTGSLGCAPGSSWLGLQAASGFLDIHCVRLQQDRARAHQVSTAIMQHWDGIRWIRNDRFSSLIDFGGGMWQSFPGRYGSMWRLRSQTVSGGVGVGVAELELYRSSTCTGRIQVTHPNVVPISSGYSSSREIATAIGSTAHFMSMGDFGQAFPWYAFDGDLGTFWAELEARPTWIGIDLNAQVTDVQCIRLVYAGSRALQPSWSYMEAWDGSAWAAQASSQTVLRFDVPFPGGAGWQERPAPLQSMWRLQNDVEVQAWEISEVEFYISTDCGGPKLVGLPIASALTTPSSVTQGGHHLPGKAFDGRLETYWEADCYLSGCLAGNAWIGLNLHAPARVRCVRMAQGATRRTQTGTSTLAFWQGERWEADSQLSGLGGGTWNMRPAMPDTLWRIVFVARQDEACPAFSTKPYRRSWGISELEFYSDEECQTRLPGPAEGAEPIASGMRVPDTVGRGVLIDSFAPKWAFDGSTQSYWAAQCSAQGREEANCVPGEEWIGLDFGTVSRGMPVEVRCVRMYQSRNIASECCDPASDMSLQRWNGTSWVEAVWRHLPRERGPMRIGGDFSGLGRCPSIVEEVSRTVNLWEKRSRRQSDTCAVPLSGAVPLLAEKLCEKQPRCKEAGFIGVCCPMTTSANTACDAQGFQAGHCSRCCCDVVSADIFEDEMQFDLQRNAIDEAPVAGVELVAIRIINVLPYIGITASVFLYIAANIPKPSLASGALPRLWFVFCWPVHHWMDQGGFIATLVAFFCRRNSSDKVAVVGIKRILILILGILLGMYLLWILICVLVAEIIIRLILLFSMVVRVAKSPFEAKDHGDKKRFAIVLAAPVSTDSTEFKVPNVADILKGIGEAFAQSIVLCVKGVLDIILIRFSLMSVDASFATVPIPDILAQVPKLPIDIQPFLNEFYKFTKFFTELFLTLVVAIFGGIPRCEGPVLIFSGMWMVIITLVLIRCLNYDFFGLLTATKNTVKATRPTFQKLIFMAATVLVQTVIFVSMQCIMLLFSRALTLADFNEEHWMCPYSGEGFSPLSGRIFLILMAVLAGVIIFLSANGHFLGQKYITAEFSQRVDMDLSRLDPLQNEKVMRTNFCLSAIPTTLGIWIDGWNVKGYLIKERAVVYAEEMKYPLKCPHCGVAHLPYHEVMKATGMQLSLAYQWFRYGVIIGKACEYFNNPPLLYLGSELKCMKVADNVARARAGMPKKMNCKKAVMFYLGLVVAHVKDHVLSLLMKLASVALYFSVVICTYMLTKQNIRHVGYTLFSLLMSLASLKALLEFTFPVIMLFLLGAVLVATKRRSKGEDKREAFRFVAPFFGQLAHAVPIGMSVAIYLKSDSNSVTLARDFAVLIGCGAGIVAGVLIMAVALVLEQCPGSHLAGKLFMATYCCGISIGIGRIGAEHLTTDQQYVVMAFVALFLVPVTCLAFRLPPLDDDRIREPSAVLPLLTSPRLLPCCYGSLAGTFVGSYFQRDITSTFTTGLTHRFGGIVALLACVCIGYFVGIVYTFVTDHVIKRRAGQWSLLVGTTLTVGFGLSIHWGVGVIIGSVVACIVGAILEHLQMKAVQAACFEPVRFTSSKVAGNPGAPQKMEETSAAPPTVMKAWMQSGTGGLDDLVLATTGLSQTGQLADAEETLRSPPPKPQNRSKRYTMGRIPIIPPAGPRDAWNPDASSAVPAQPAPTPSLVPAPASSPHPALQAQSISAAGQAQLAAMGMGGGSAAGSVASSTRTSARGRPRSTRQQ